MLTTNQPTDKIRLEHLSKRFRVKKQKITAVQDITLNISEGEFVAVVGPSGCGKTTLLRILAGLDDPSEGVMTITHKNVNQPLNAMVFQEHSVFPWMTVRQNIAYGLNMRKVSKTTVQAVVNEYLDKIGLRKFANAYPHQLSGGMKQRVSVARAFANNPEILLMDEPFAALDEQNRLTLQQELVRIWEETRKTVVFITHSIDEAIFLGDRIILMSAHPGRICSSYEVDLPRPRRIEEVRSNPRYHELFTRIWQHLKTEVIAAHLQEGRST